jgi:endoglucanase
LWATTGDAEVLKELEARIGAIRGRVDRNWDWATVNNLGLFTYVFTDREGRSAELVNQVKGNIVSVANDLVKASEAHGYARPMGTNYGWGCNGTVARQAMNLMAANRIAPDAKYVETAINTLNYLLGRNCYGRSFVTGLGENPPMNPHDRRSGGDGVKDPWPGYLVGGPNPSATSWTDNQDDYRNNEIAINWNGALIYAFSAFVVSDGQ